MLTREEPRLFPKYEGARSAVRYARGLRDGHRGQRIPAPVAMSLPAAIPSGWRVHTLPDEPRRYLVLGDLHVPYHDRRALQLALEYGRKAKARGLVILGDMVDFYDYSDFEKDPRVNSPDGGIDEAEELLDVLGRQFGKHIWWVEGNHERRLTSYMVRHAPALMKMDSFSLARCLRFQERGVTWIPNGQPLVHHALVMLHGNEWRGVAAPVNAARRAYLQAGECVLVAHAHQDSEHQGTTATGRVVTAHSLGCLCDLHPNYAPLNRWCHGFALLDAGNKWRVERHKIINGEVL
jgi:predicted phosphodiesterase